MDASGVESVIVLVAQLGDDLDGGQTGILGQGVGDDLQSLVRCAW